jgi:hypothetical protein
MDRLATHPLTGLAQKLGEIAIGRSDLHFLLFVLFSRMNCNDLASCWAQFFAVHSDRDRRDMVIALAEQALKPWPTTKRHMLTTIGGIGKLEERRTAVIRAMSGFHAQAGSAPPSAQARPAPADLARDVDALLQAIIDMARTLIHLSDELDDYLPPADRALQVQRLSAVYRHADGAAAAPFGEGDGQAVRDVAARPPEPSQA